jgi:hypothetical protein
MAANFEFAAESAVHQKSLFSCHNHRCSGYGDIGSHVSKEIRWQDVSVVRQCGDKLTLVNNSGEVNSFDFKELNHSIDKFAVINLVPSNFIWPIVVAPICLIQWLNSFRTGHSRAVIDVLEAHAIKELTA